VERTPGSDWLPPAREGPPASSNSALLYSTLLYSTLLYSTLFHCTLLYATLLYSTPALHYPALLYSTSACLPPPSGWSYCHTWNLVVIYLKSQRIAMCYMSSPLPLLYSWQCILLLKMSGVLRFRFSITICQGFPLQLYFYCELSTVS
jgi:hypothetical protein